MVVDRPSSECETMGLELASIRGLDCALCAFGAESLGPRAGHLFRHFFFFFFPCQLVGLEVVICKKGFFYS